MALEGGKRYIDAILPGEQFRGGDDPKATGGDTPIVRLDKNKTVAGGDTGGDPNTGQAAVAAAGTTHNLGSLNGVFYTDATTSKPTFQNYLQGSNTASDIVAFITDDPNQIYEVRSNNSGASAQTDVGNTAEISYSAGASPNYVSRTTLDDSTLATATQQLKIVGVSRDADNDDLTSANVVWRVVINEHFFGATTGI